MTIEIRPEWAACRTRTADEEKALTTIRFQIYRPLDFTKTTLTPAQLKRLGGGGQ